ncbi:FAD-dependent oxidoreductase [Dokdonella sp.]|uniref:NAD(P)/FAD-dependent oxidoreductase n=1 Tax=Dokdonella sp. TaxID=2291710 RepID=UPI0025C4646F|nr:FAD-dependent oxidoreductase [Dokdonella sp.]MBX3688060.1 FAD-dependent oxidoreductase [Dokdonella sp.]
MEQARSNDVLILGGGVIGLACAWFLLKAGRGVTVLEQDRAGSGSSHGNCGTLTPSHAMPLAMPGTVGTALRWLLRPDAPLRIKPRPDLQLLRWLLAFRRRCNWSDALRTTAAKLPLLEASRKWIEELVRAEQLDCEFAASGTLHVFRDPRELERARSVHERLAMHLPPCEVLDAAAAIAREPALKPGLAGAILHAGDASLRPDRFVAELARIVRAAGGRMVEGARIEKIVHDGTRIARVATTRGEFSADEVVLALGAWSPRFARDLDLRIPIQPGKGYSITYRRPALCPRMPLTLKERAVCVTSWESGYRLGSTMEFAGYDDTLNRTRLDALRRGAAEYLREPEGPALVEEWFGWRPMTSDDLPLIGRVPHLRNLVLATGHGMLGVTMSVATGVLVSEIVTARQPSLDIAAFAPARFN